MGEAPLARLRVRPGLRLRRHLVIVTIVACVFTIALAGARYLRPVDLVTRPVPEVVSMTRREAEAAIRRAGLTPAVKLTESSEETLWERVLQQSPLAGMRAANGQQVRLLVAVREKGLNDSREVGPLITYEEALPQAAEAPPRPSHRQAAPKEARVATAFGVPEVRGKHAEEARRLLRALGLGMRTAGRAYSNSVPRGRVVRQTPAPGEAPPAEESVRVVVSRGPRPRPATQAPHALATIRSEPRDCEVWVYVDGGRAVGKCPCTIRLSPGQRTITLWDTTHLKEIEFTVAAKAGTGFSVQRRVHEERAGQDDVEPK